MEDADRWVKLANFGTTFEAELAKATLESSDIPAMIQSHGGTGIFGAGYQGPVPGGVTVLVPARELDRAWTVVVEQGA